jgi:hypothetical protein
MPTKEERDARNAAERARYAAMSPEERAALLARTAEWKKKRAEVDPDAHRAARKAQIERQEARMKTDPEYAERRRAYQREQKRARRAEERAAREAAAAVAPAEVPQLFKHLGA